MHAMTVPSSPRRPSLADASSSTHAERCDLDPAAICRWLHDDPLQVLEYLARGESSPEEVRLVAGEAADRLRELVDNDLRLPEEPVELVSGLCEVLHEISARAKTPIDLKVGRMERVITGEPARTLLGAVREALTNVQKHARADRVEVHCEVSESRVFVWVSDDGVGFDPREANAKGRFGMQHSIIGRVQTHGHVRVLAQQGHGTVVEMRLENPGPLATPVTSGTGRDGRSA